MTVARRVLIDCDGAAAGLAVPADGWTARRSIRSTGPGADLDLNLAAFGGAILKDLSPRSIDLIRLAAYIYRADQIVSRGGGRDAHAARWRRLLRLCVPVADPTFWSNAGVTERLAAALRFLTDDAWEFAFAEAPPALRQIPLRAPSEAVIGQPTSVVTLSGGVDSLCVLLEAAETGGRPVAVSHWSAETHKVRQLRLLAKVRERFRHWAFPIVGLPLHGVGGDPPDSSQRSRGFLYAALATAVAGELGLHDVRFGDNGPVSINLPINDQLVGALASRSTHPQFLYRFNRLAKVLYPAPVTVTNPLQERTRAEALEVLKTTRCADLLPLTLSCSKWRTLPAATPQCGECSQCVDRRFATIAAGLEAHDPATRYRCDLFLDEPKHWEGVTTTQSYVRFAQENFPLNAKALIAKYSHLYDLPTPDDPDPEATVQGAVDLIKRHTASTLDVLTMMVGRHADALVERRLPPGCLLRKAIADTELDGTRAADEQPDAGKQPTGQALGPTTVSRPENVFAFEGQLWTATYAGTTKHLRDSKGMRRLAILLREPGREFTAEELWLAAAGVADQPLSLMQIGHLELRPEAYAGGGTKIDRETVAAAKAEINQLLRELDDARDQGDAEEVERLESEIGRIGREVKSGVGFGGVLRPFVDDQSRRRDSVYKSLRRILPQVARVHPALGEHLKRSVQTTAPFSYAPEGSVTWQVVLPM